LERYRELAGTGLASADFETVLKAACHARVDTLFVALGVQRWGSHSPDSDEIQTYEKPASKLEDLLDRAAVECFKHSGSIYALAPADIPENKSLAVIMRY
jgi:hypothetical protein